MTAEDYIRNVLGRMPSDMSSGAEIATELRGHIAERVGSGQPLDAVLRQLGDPATLAASYLSAEPLDPAPPARRIAAKAADVLLVLAVIAPFGVGMIARWGWGMFGVLPLLVFLGGSLLFGAYTIVLEARWGRTLGKKWLDLRVVRESGARISFGQAIVRQLPMFVQVYWIDALFALCTDKQQRAFELLSKTRVVTVVRSAKAAGRSSPIGAHLSAF
jgi:uncharacterized RDD family membrane protein YckC